MRRIIKISLAIVLVLIIIVATFAAVFFLDLVAYTATSQRTLPYTGQFMGTALVLYDPGLTGASAKVAEKIAEELQNQTLAVTLGGIKSQAAANTTGYDVIVIGGPIYAGTPTASVKDALSNLKHDSDTVVGVFGSGQGAKMPDENSMRNAIPALQPGGALSKAVVVKITDSEDLNAQVQDFVTQLIRG